MVGVNPEVGHEQMSGLNFYHVVAQAIEAGKLFHIDLNDQKGPRFDQDLRFGSESIKNLFFLVRLLEDAYDGPRHFDAHSYRSEDEAGVWAFAAGCMRNYLILKEKGRQFDEDQEIKALLDEIHNNNGDTEPLGRYSREKAQKLKDLPLDRAELASKPLPYERLDQLTVDILFGVR
jgi:xylose isomerase